jgi:asparagine synthase (glutamine-hydrolysing)
MCGLVGSFNTPEFDVSARLELIRHRGPDGSGVVAAGPATHGHVRLALLDLSHASDQPFRYRDGLLSFNGEIWNFQTVRAELEGLGHIFSTTGDTEVLAAALTEWDVDALMKLEGMFTFAWSRGARHLLGRDRFGKIPLYVSRRGASFVWASERKALTGYRADALPEGSVLNLVTGLIERWYVMPDHTLGIDIIDRLTAGVKARLIADAPLCCLISGGLDSSLILTIAKRLKPDIAAYTAVLDEGSADLRAARRLCAENEVPLTEVRVRRPTPSDLSSAARCIEIASKVQTEIAALCIPLARAISSDGFRACLSGEAADELFGGYGSMCIQGARASDEGWRHIRLQQLSRMARGNFVRCNKAFMAHGVECRLPFMERSLVEGVINMTKAACPPAKKALKAAAGELLPAWIVRRIKETFQGGAGMDAAAAQAIARPKAFYRAEVLSAFGVAAME